MSSVKTSFSLVRRQCRSSYLNEKEKRSVDIFISFSTACLFHIRQTCQELLYFSVLQLIEAHFIHLQLVLLLLALVSVPWMLLPKPFLLKRQHEVCSFKLLCFCPLNIVVFLYHVLSSFSLHCLSEAPGRILCTPSRYRGVSAIRGTPWRFSRSRGVWIQRSFCTSAYTHNRICPWGSFKYSFLSSFMGSQVKITLKLRKEKGISIHPFLHTMEILENFFFNLSLSWNFTNNNFTQYSHYNSHFLLGDFSLAHSELSTVFYEKVLLLAWGWVWFLTLKYLFPWMFIHFNV